MILMEKMMTKHYILVVPNFEPRPQLQANDWAGRPCCEAGSAGT